MGRRHGIALASLTGVLNKSQFEAWFGKIRFKAWFGNATLLFYLCTVVMVISLLLGGGTRHGFLSDAILQLLAIPLLLASIWRMFEVELTKPMRVALGFCLAIALLPLIQLVPLPPWLWTALPQRQPSVEAFEVLGRAVPWMPISVSPRATWLSALSLIPPLAIFLSTLLLGYRERRWLSLVVLAVGILSVFIGLLQVAQGPDSPLRFFAITNPTEAVGFFANRNHFAALIYCLVLFVVVWTLAKTTAGAPSNKNNFEYDATSIMVSLLGFTVLVILLAGEAMARSRAGLGLTMVALLGAIALGYASRRAGSGITANKLLIGAIALAATFSLQFALYRVLERFTFDPVQDARQIFVRNTIEAAQAYMPFGSGLGTFVQVYAMFEKPEDVSNAYANHAHNDVLEVWLETGVVGLALLGLFVIWLVRRGLEIWRRSEPPVRATEVDWSLARVSVIVIFLLLVHSFFDYPLRTGALMAVTAFVCALLIEPPASARDKQEFELQTVSEKTRKTRHRTGRWLEPTPSPALRKATSVSPPSLVVASDPPASSPGRRWGSNIEWPKEWSGSSNDKQGSASAPKPQDS